MRKIIGIALAVITATALCLGLAGCSSSSPRTLDQIKESGKIIIGVFSDKHPFGYVDDQGTYQGYDIELANRIGEDLGVKVEMVSTEAANRVEYLKTAKVDIILANFTVTEERAQEVDFAKAYMNVALGTVSHNSNVITDLSQITESTNVMVISGTTAETFMAANYKDIKLQKFDNYASCKSAFENDETALWINDNTEVIAFASSNAGYTVGIDHLGSDDKIAPAVAKDNSTLLDWLNDELVTLGSENFFHKDYTKTLASVYGEQRADKLVIEPTN